MITLDQYNNLGMDQAMPNIGDDLIAANEAGVFTGLPADRLMAALELLRHHEISRAQAAVFANVSEETVIQLLRKLDLPLN